MVTNLTLFFNHQGDEPPPALAAGKPLGGCIVNVGSISGQTIDNTGAPYHMSKASMNHMTRLVIRLRHISSQLNSSLLPPDLFLANLHHGISRYLACEWGATHGVRVNAVAPWFIRTPLTDPILKVGRKRHTSQYSIRAIKSLMHPRPPSHTLFANRGTLLMQWK